MQIRRSLANFPWENFLKSNPIVNWQVERFTEIVLNVMSNFIPSKVIKVNPRDPPWIDGDLKRMLNRQQRLYQNYKRHGFKSEDKVRVDRFRDECNIAVQNAKKVIWKKWGIN